MAKLQIRIKKDRSFRDVLNDFDKVLTAISDIIKLDLSDSLNYPTIEVTGEMSGTGIIAISTERLATPRSINIVGETLGNATFDGTADININTRLARIYGISIDSIFENVEGVIYSKHTLRANECDVADVALSSQSAVDATNSIFIIPKDGETSGGLLKLEGAGTYKDISIENKNQVLSISGINVVGGNTLTFNPVNGDVTAKKFVGTATNTSGIAGVQCNNTLITPAGTDRVNIEGYVYTTRSYVTESSDYAECFDSNGLNYEEVNHRIVEVDEDGNIQLGSLGSTRVIGIVSDNYGYLLSGSEEDIKSGKKIPIGLTGVLFVDSKDKVDKFNVGKLIGSDTDGYAKVLLYPKFGISVGKIIGIDEENNRYKVIISLL